MNCESRVGIRSKVWIGTTYLQLRNGIFQPKLYAVPPEL